MCCRNPPLRPPTKQPPTCTTEEHPRKHQQTTNQQNNLCSLNKRNELGSTQNHRNHTTETDTYSRIFCKITQSFGTSLGLPLFLHRIATALKFLYLIATLTSLLIASACKLMVIRYCLMRVVTLRSYETAL